MRAKTNFSFKIINFIFVFLLICLYFEILGHCDNQKLKSSYPLVDQNISKCPNHRKLKSNSINTYKIKTLESEQGCLSKSFQPKHINQR